MRELKPTVFMVDNEAGMVKSLRNLMESVQLPVETYPGVSSLWEGLDVSRPGCLILDVRMPEMSGLELCRRLRRAGSALPAIFVTEHGDVPTAVQAMQEGAFDFFQRPFSEQYLLDRVHAALEKNRCDRYRTVEREAAAVRFETLSAKERQVLGLIVDGMTSKAMARELGIGLKTVDFHRANIMRKVGVETVGELVCTLFKGGYGGVADDIRPWGEWATTSGSGGTRRISSLATAERRLNAGFGECGPGDTVGTAIHLSGALCRRRGTTSRATAGMRAERI